MGLLARARDLETAHFEIIAGIRACSQYENGTFQCSNEAQPAPLVQEWGHSSTRTQIAVPHAYGSEVFAKVKPRWKSPHCLVCAEAKVQASYDFRDPLRPQDKEGHTRAGDPLRQAQR